MLLSTRFAEQGMEILPLRRVRFPQTYTNDYVTKLYDRIVYWLQDRQPINHSRDRDKLLRDANFILFYVDLNDGKETLLVERFGVEALVISLNISSILQMPTVTRSQRNGVSNIVFKAIHLAFQQVDGVIHIISQEVTNRRNKTCLLLPPKTFGREFLRVRDQVHYAARERWTGDQFQNRLRKLSSSIPMREGYFMKGGIVFKSAGRGMHGLPPVWDDDPHNATCVIRGRLRFGVSFDPRFHYDCQLPNRGNITFPGCHESESVGRNRQHVNVAPNDNVR